MTDTQVSKLAETLIALQLGELPRAEIDARIATTIGDADRDVALAALNRVTEILRARSEAAAREVGVWTMIERLSNATQCPDGTSAVTWLKCLGLIETDGAGGYVATPKAGLRVV